MPRSGWIYAASPIPGLLWRVRDSQRKADVGQRSEAPEASDLSLSLELATAWRTSLAVPKPRVAVWTSRAHSVSAVGGAPYLS